MPITNNTLGYEIKRDLNSITIIETGSRDISIQIFYKNSSNSFSKVTGILDVTDLVVFKIPFQDGKYKIRITSTNPTTEEFEYKEYIFTSYNKLLDSIIRDTKQFLCGCECKNCNDNCDDTKSKSNLLLKMISFYMLNKDYYSFFFNTGLDCIEDSVLKSINCITIGEAVGKEFDDTIYKDIIGYLYYIFYIAERSIYTCCSEQIDSKFNIDNILPCLEKNNINFKCLESSILTNSDFYISDSNLIEL